MQRLKTRAQFQAVLAGVVIAKTVHFALHRNQLDAPAVVGKAGKVDKAVPSGQADRPAGLFPQQDMWIGAMVPKRWAKRAVTRNAIKRQIYAVSNELCMPYPHLAFVVRLRCGFAKNKFPSAVSDLLRQVVRAELQALMETGFKAA